MADNSGNKIADVAATLKAALERISAQNSPIHAAISLVHRQFKSQATPARVVQIHLWED